MPTVPLGIAAAVVTQNAYRGRALVRAVFLIPYVLPSFVVATVWRTMPQPGGLVNTWLERLGMAGGLWLDGPRSYWASIVVETWAAWPLLLGWSDVLFASVLTRPETRTAAAALIWAAPVVLLYLVLQRYLVGGLTAGGVK